MSLEELITKGIIKTCDKHGAELVYFDATQECPVCKVVIQNKPINKKKLPTSLIKKEPEKVEETIEEPKGLIERFKAMPTKKKAILIGAAIVIMWVAMNVGSIMSYFK